MAVYASQCEVSTWWRSCSLNYGGGPGTLDWEVTADHKNYVFNAPIKVMFHPAGTLPLGRVKDTSLNFGLFWVDGGGSVFKVRPCKSEFLRPIHIE